MIASHAAVHVLCIAVILLVARASLVRLHALFGGNFGLQPITPSNDLFSRHNQGIGTNHAKQDAPPIFDLCIVHFVFSVPPNGLRYLRVGGRGFCLGAGKTRSVENA